MKDLLTKLSKSEVRDRKKKFSKLHPRDAEKKKSELFCKSYFGILQEERNLNKK